MKNSKKFAVTIEGYYPEIIVHVWDLSLEYLRAAAYAPCQDLQGHFETREDADDRAEKIQACADRDAQEYDFSN